MKRENGYYWVKMYGDWCIASFEDGLWWIFGFNYGEKEPIQIFEEIDETPITRTP